jgi:putative DNA primase/helicase
MSSNEKAASLVLEFAAQRPAQSAVAPAPAVVSWRREVVAKPALVASPAPPRLEDARPREDAAPQGKPDEAPPIGPPTLNPNAPMDNAREFARRHCYQNGDCIVWYWQDQFWRWNGKVYAAEEPAETEGQVWKFLDGASRWAGQGRTERFLPTERHVKGVLAALKACLALGKGCQPPMWLSTREPATDWIAFRNGVVNVLTGELRQPSPDLWVQSALGFDWDPDAPCPRWVQFLEETFPGDEESKQFAEEWMGYCMTEETRFQKGAMLIGARRSGKGTITHVLRQMVGDTGYVGLSFDTWVATENSRAPMIGKRVGVFADIRFKQGRAYGSSYDPGGISHVSSGLLLNIIGEDPLSLGRKNVGSWEGQLRLKLMLLANQVPNFNDAGGVLPSRFIKLHFGVSFFNREDPYLKDKLCAELSGIAARCVAAYQRLCLRGRFVQPRSGEALERAVLAASDPFTAMALDCFVPDPMESVIKTVAYSRFERWCEENRRMDIKLPANKFGDALRAVAGFERINGDHRPLDPATGKQGPRVWLGMRLRKDT